MSAAMASPQRNPFPGLRPFRDDEAHLFFGRENQVDAMVNKLADTRFLAVVGTSGSGKSSLVNCGLRPALRQGLMARAGTVWRMAQFRPGRDPIGAMARALAQDGVLFPERAAAGLTLAEIIETTLRMSKLGLIDICEQAALDDGVNLLVVVDQFEELFRYQQLGAAGRGGEQGIGEEAAAFVNLLLEVKQRATCPIFVVLTMRSDFLGDCTQFPGLAEAINAGQYLVPRMTRDERRAAIEGPVGVGGAEIAPVLLTRLVNDVGDNPDQLSILQHALNRTWAHWQNEGAGKGPLDLAHYEAIGTMAHALDQHAEQAYAELGTTRQQQICETLFKALTDKATDLRGVRRPTTLGKLCGLADATAAEVTDVIAVFRDPSRSFLMPPAGDALKAETPIDISHESLMRVWQRLIEWADEELLSARTYRRLADTADLYAAGTANLWRDPELQVALDWRDKSQPNEAWASRYHAGFAAAMRFLTGSSEAREAERAERQQQRQEKAEAQARYARRMRWAVLFSGALAVFAVVFGVMAYEAGREAIKQRDKANTQQVQALSEMAWIIGRLAKYLKAGTISIVGARELFGDTQARLDSLISDSQEQSPEITLVATKLLLNISDVNYAFGEHDEALKRAKQAGGIAQQLLAKNPDNPEFKHLVYDSAFRVGDAQSKESNYNDAQKEYQTAFDIADKLAKSAPDKVDHQRDLAFIINKIGDVYRTRQNWPEAIKQYQISLGIAQKLAGQDPDSREWPRNVATTKSRIGEVLEAKGDYAEALVENQSALEILMQLLHKYPDDDTLLSNLAAIHRRIGQALYRDGKYEGSQQAYVAAVEIREKLHGKDPGNADWSNGLATDHKLVADVLMLNRDWSNAGEHYRAALRLRMDLAFRVPSNASWKRNLAIAHGKLGEALAAQNQFDDASTQYGAAVNIFHEIGDTLVQQCKHDKALAPYRSALAVAVQAATGDPGSTTWQGRLSSAYEKIGDALATADGTRKDALAQYQRALPIIEAAAAKDPSLKQQHKEISEKVEKTVRMVLERGAANDQPGLTPRAGCSSAQ